MNPTGWRKNNPDKNKELRRREKLSKGWIIRKKQRVGLIKEFIRLIKELEPCADCGKNFPYYIMEFDHVRGSKRGNVSTISDNSWKQVLEEIDKCDVVCSNCHKRREYDRKEE